MELYYIDKKFSIEAFFSAFSFKWDSKFVFNGECHAPWEAVFITEGCVGVTEDEKIYKLKAGDMILHAPMEFHRIRSIDGSSPRGIIMSFLVSGELPKELKNGIFALDDEQKREYEAIFQKIRPIIINAEHSQYASLDAAASLTSFLIRLGENEHAQKHTISTQSAVEYKKVVSMMKEGVCANLTLDAIAQSCNVSVSYVKLLFKKYSGISPKTYYSNMRLRHACELLDSGMAVSEVSSTMRFSSPNYFCVFFKRSMNISPSEYQKKTEH